MPSTYWMSGTLPDSANENCRAAIFAANFKLAARMTALQLGAERNR